MSLTTPFAGGRKQVPVLLDRKCYAGLCAHFSSAWSLLSPPPRWRTVCMIPVVVRHCGQVKSNSQYVPLRAPASKWDGRWKGKLGYPAQRLPVCCPQPVILFHLPTGSGLS